MLGEARWWISPAVPAAHSTSLGDPSAARGARSIVRAGQRRKLPRALAVQPHAPAHRPAEVTQEEAVSAAVQRRYSLG